MLLSMSAKILASNNNKHATKVHIRLYYLVLLMYVISVTKVSQQHLRLARISPDMAALESFSCDKHR
nr:hypothetical protein BCU57_17235 [Shewanella sp. 10N.286.48.B5]PMH94764.1 hypothetical protein BCU55_03815 [Shewanella sp. 10N.286.48.A6]